MLGIKHYIFFNLQSLLSKDIQVIGEIWNSNWMKCNQMLLAANKTKKTGNIIDLKTATVIGHIYWCAPFSVLTSTNNGSDCEDAAFQLSWVWTRVWTAGGQPPVHLQSHHTIRSTLLNTPVCAGLYIEKLHVDLCIFKCVVLSLSTKMQAFYEICISNIDNIKR